MTTKYRYNGELFDSFDDVSDHIREELNELHEPYVIGGREFYAGDILANLDSVGFHSDYVSPHADEEDWELIADDVNGLDYQVDQAESVMEKDFPREYKQYLHLISNADYYDPEVGGITAAEKADEIEHLTDYGIKWDEGYVWRVKV